MLNIQDMIMLEKKPQQYCLSRLMILKLKGKPDFKTMEKMKLVLSFEVNLDIILICDFKVCILEPP